MNKARRARLAKVIDELDAIISEEQEAYDNLPESIQASDSGSAREEIIYTLTDAKDNIEGVTNT